MNTLVTGGTGFVGRRLISRLDSCSITTRSPQRAKQKLGSQIDDAFGWDYSKDDLELPDGKFEGIVNLMGESIAEGRWNEAKKKRIRESRVLGTEQLVTTILNMENRPSVVVSSSAVGIYGDQGARVIDEQGEAATGFLAEVCREWEEATLPLAQEGIRVVLLRIGIVLGQGGGALAKLLPIFRLGVGGRLGRGDQYVPWIHVDDLVSLILWALESEKVSGPLNGTAPNPVTNADLTRQLASAVRRPAIFPVPQFGLRLALGEFADSLFVSQNVMPEKALQFGFQFEYPDLAGALANIVSK